MTLPISVSSPKATHRDHRSSPPFSILKRRVVVLGLVSYIDCGNVHGVPSLVLSDVANATVA